MQARICFKVSSALQLLGLILLGIGVWTVVDFETFSSVFGTNQILFQDASIITIVAGSVITLIGVLGCVAAREDSNFLLGVVRAAFC